MFINTESTRADVGQKRCGQLGINIEGRMGITGWKEIAGLQTVLVIKFGLGPGLLQRFMRPHL